MSPAHAALGEDPQVATTPPRLCRQLRWVGPAMWQGALAVPRRWDAASMRRGTCLNDRSAFDDVDSINISLSQNGAAATPRYFSAAARNLGLTPQAVSHAARA
jgi:hypothetical protein